MYDFGVSYTFNFHKINTESSVIFLRNGVLIFNPIKAGPFLGGDQLGGVPCGTPPGI